MEENCINLKDYIMNKYSQFFDMTEGRYNVLNSILDSIYASYIDLDSFKNFFGFGEYSFIDILKFITDRNNYEILKLYGSQWINESDITIEQQTRLIFTK